MTGPRLEGPDGSWSPIDFKSNVEDKLRWLTQHLDKGQTIWRFSAPTTPESVWTFHALAQLGITALPTPVSFSPTLDEAYATAEQKPVNGHTQLRLLTSGSTGQPSVVDLTTTQINASITASRAHLGCEPSDRWLCCLPLHHIAGISILMRTAHAGATTILQSKFEPNKVNVAIDNQRITMVSLVPSMLARVLDDRGDTPFPDHLRVILLGGAPATRQLIERCRSISAPVALTWGMTETASQISTRVPGDLRTDPDVGQPLPGHTVSVNGGRLVVEGPIAPNGRFVTNDCGYLDPQGRVVVTGRGHRLIISGGENIDPARVEMILKQHPSIEDAAVIGIQDETWGQRVEAVVVGEASTALSHHLNDQLEPHERPKKLHWVSALPRTPLGKIDRGAIMGALQS